jgi:hypothetical protein
MGRRLTILAIDDAHEGPTGVGGDHTSRVTAEPLPLIDIHLLSVPAEEARQALSVAIPGLTALAGAWLQARFGRKVRIKIGDIEAEASSLEEVRELLEQSKKYCADDEVDQ